MKSGPPLCGAPAACPFCNSELHDDRSEGCTVCRLCGFVAEERLLETDEVTFHPSQPRIERCDPPPKRRARAPLRTGVLQNLCRRMQVHGERRQQVLARGEVAGRVAPACPQRVRHAAALASLWACDGDTPREWETVQTITGVKSPQFARLALRLSGVARSLRGFLGPDAGLHAPKALRVGSSLPA